MGFWKKSDEEFEKEIEGKIHSEKQEKIRGELETERLKRELSKERESLNKEKSHELKSMQLERLRKQRKGGRGGFMSSARDSLGNARDSVGRAVDMFVPTEKQRSIRSGGILGATGFDVGGGKSFNIMGSSGGLGLGGGSGLWGNSLGGSSRKHKSHKGKTYYKKVGKKYIKVRSRHLYC